MLDSHAQLDFDPFFAGATVPANTDGVTHRVHIPASTDGVKIPCVQTRCSLTGNACLLHGWLLVAGWVLQPRAIEAVRMARGISHLSACMYMYM